MTRALVLVVVLTGALAAFASPAWAPIGPHWTTAAAANASSGPVQDNCRTDAALRQQCTTLKNTCLSQSHKTRLCDGDYYDCCHHLAIRRW